MNACVERVGDLLRESGFYDMISYFKGGGWQTLVMLLLSLVLIYLAIVKKFEPLLLLPIAFGMLLANLPLACLLYTSRQESEMPCGQERIQWVRASYESVSGTIEAAWYMEEDTFTYIVTVPKESYATLYLPV